MITRDSTWRVDELTVHAFTSTADFGRAVADRVAEEVRRDAAAHGRATVVLAPSAADHPVTRALRVHEGIDWSRVRVLDVDEYVGVGLDAAVSTGGRLLSALMEHVPCYDYSPLIGDRATQEEIWRYRAMLEEQPPAVTLLGIGADGHLAFNVPPADFTPSELVRLTSVPPYIRRLILDAGMVDTYDDVPAQAITLTISGLLLARRAITFSDEPDQAPIIRDALDGAVTSRIPLSVLRTAPGAELYLGPRVSSLLN